MLLIGLVNALLQISHDYAMIKTSKDFAICLILLFWGEMNDV